MRPVRQVDHRHAVARRQPGRPVRRRGRRRPTARTGTHTWTRAANANPGGAHRSTSRARRAMASRTAPASRAAAVERGCTSATRPPRRARSMPARRNRAAVSTYGATAAPNRSRRRSWCVGRPARGGGQLPLERRVADDEVEPGLRAGRPGLATDAQRVGHHEVSRASARCRATTGRSRPRSRPPPAGRRRRPRAGRGPRRRSGCPTATRCRPAASSSAPPPQAGSTTVRPAARAGALRGQRHEPVGQVGRRVVRALLALVGR